jgi:hypothetical protein
LSQVANKLVDDYYQGKSINADEVTAVVEQLDKDFIFSERLVFLSKVRDLNIFKEVPHFLPCRIHHHKRTTARAQTWDSSKYLVCLCSKRTGVRLRN